MIKEQRSLIVSTSKIYGSEYLEYLRDELADFFSGAEEILFIPYARPGGISHDEYTRTARTAFAKLSIRLSGLHEREDPAAAIEEAQAIFTGGGNTFVLLKQLYDKGLIRPLREFAKRGKPYMGSSAGSNITGQSIGTTNDMPIVYPPSFEALRFVPFNINPHYLDPPENSRHMGETRETRIGEFLRFNEQKVIGLREGSWLRVENAKVHLRGPLSARIFERDREPREVEPGDITSILLSG